MITFGWYDGMRGNRDQEKGDGRDRAEIEESCAMIDFSGEISSERRLLEKFRAFKATECLGRIDRPVPWIESVAAGGCSKPNRG